MSTTKINKIYSKPVISSISYIYISGQIGHPEEYIEEIQALKEAEQGDEVNLFINTEGGSVHTAVQLVTAITNCKANVVGHIEGICHSAGTYLFLSCDEWQVNPHCMMMIHNYSGGSYGKGEELVDGVLGTHLWITNMMEDIYDTFLTPKEIKRVIKGKDIYLTSAQILERLPRLLEARELAEEIAEEDAMKLLTEQFTQALSEDENEGKNLRGIS